MQLWMHLRVLNSLILGKKTTAGTVDSLKAFPFIKNVQVINDLKSELPSYLATADGIPRDIDPLEW